MGDWIEKLGILAGVAMPFFNFPLIARLLQRKSSSDISLTWALGVWVCVVLMTPQAVRSHELAFRLFGIMNLFSFSLVTFFVLKYKRSTIRRSG